MNTYEKIVRKREREKESPERERIDIRPKGDRRRLPPVPQWIGPKATHLRVKHQKSHNHPYQCKHFLSHRGRKTIPKVNPKKNNSIERDRGQELLQVLCYPYETKHRRGQVMRKMTLLPKGLIKALVWFCGIGGVEIGSHGVHDEWRHFANDLCVI